MRPKVKFLTVVWGEAYIKRFASLALPSFLAPGNLPALAQTTDLEVVIMTRQSDFPRFANHATFIKLHKICPVRFVAIDDLITTAVYGVTLTLAYARPIIACGREMLDTHFVFMNADFVLADGSLRALGKHIFAGRSIVLGPSFRATAESVEPLLKGAVSDISGALSIAPRRLAALSLAHPHPTTVAKVLNQNFCHSTQPNQFFWQVDEHTILARYYLIFMLCLRPERVIKAINCFCDYSFIPEMCPSGDEAVMDDSDDFFMLELQQRNQEMGLLRLGQQADDAIARSLQYWTTAEHRRAASHDIVFHTKDIPAGIAAAKSEANAFINRIGKKLGRPVLHTRHPYWIQGVEAWQHYRKEQELSTTPPELAPLPRSALGWLWSIIFAVRRRIVGAAQFLPLHPYWLDYRLLRQIITNLKSTPGARILVVREQLGVLDGPRIMVARESVNVVDRLWGASLNVQFANLQDVLNQGMPTPNQGAVGFTHALLYLHRKDCRSVQRLIKQCESAMVPEGTFHVFIHHILGEFENSNFSSELLEYLEELIDTSAQNVSCSFVGSRLKRFNVRLFARPSQHYARFGIWSLLWILPMLAVVRIPFSLAANLYMALKMPSCHFVDYCSSIAIRFKAVQAPASSTMDGNAESMPG